MSVVTDTCLIKKDIWEQIKYQGERIIHREPMLQHLVEQAILKHKTFGEALCYRLAMKCGGQLMTSEFFHTIFIECLQLSRETGNKEEDIEVLAMEDLISVEKNDPACRSLAQALLYFKGYKAIQCYRMAHILWKSNRKDIAMLIQARCTEVFGKE
jgi:serine O-acetyltransferase